MVATSFAVGTGPVTLMAPFFLLSTEPSTLGSFFFLVHELDNLFFLSNTRLGILSIFPGS